MNKKSLIILDYTEEKISLDELCEKCNIPMKFVLDLVEYDVVKPHGSSSGEWFVDLNQAELIKRAMRLQHDLELNIAGVAVVLDLLEELEDWRTRTALLERHLFYRL